MIYTLTFNPSLDYFVGLDSFVLGRTNRTTSEKMLPGGKGLNVSMVLSNLGVPNTALGFVAGFVGEEIQKRLLSMKVPCDLIALPLGCSRINVKLKDFEGTEINGMGPVVDEEAYALLMQKLVRLKAGDTLVLSGSTGQGMPPSTYENILEVLSGKGIRFVVDAAGELLLRVLPYHPFLIKPNRHELEELFHVLLSSKEDVLFYAQKLKDMGAQNVLVSLGGEGAALIDENKKTYAHAAPRGKLINAVGAGDSMVAGFLWGYEESGDYKEAFYRGLAAGSASAYSEELAKKPAIEALLYEINSTCC